MKSKNRFWLMLGISMGIMLICSISSRAIVYVENPVNYEKPPASNVVLEDAFSVVPGYASKIHPVNKQQVIITEDITSARGGIWYQYPIDLSYDFTFEMYVYLGNKDQGSLGADGITFTLHNDPRKLTAIGEAGPGLGAYPSNSEEGYIKNALSIEIDTFLNRTSPSPHDMDVSTASVTHLGVVRPVALSKIKDDNRLEHINLYEDTTGYFLRDEWRELIVNWQADTGLLTYEFPGFAMGKQSVTVDVQEWFGGTQVYWGFTGSTGSYSNYQSVAITKLPQEPDTEIVKKARNVTAGESDFSYSTDADYGDIVEFQIYVENHASSIIDMYDTVVRDTLDSSLVFQAGSLFVDGVSVTPTVTDGTYTINVGDILVGGKKTMVFRCQVTGSGTDSKISNTAMIGSKYSEYKETNAAVIYTQPDLEINKQVDKQQTYTGDRLTYTISLKNKAGRGEWQGYIIDSLPSDLGDISVTIDYNSYSGSSLTPVLTGNELKVKGVTLKGGEEIAVIIDAEIQTENNLTGSGYKIRNRAAAVGSGKHASGNLEEVTLTSPYAETELLKDIVSLTIKKEIDHPADRNLPFVFCIEYRQKEDSPEIKMTQYGVVVVKKGQNSGEISIRQLEPGCYTVSEVDSSWRYSLVDLSARSQMKTINFAVDHFWEYNFANKRHSRLWVSNAAYVENQMSADIF